MKLTGELNCCIKPGTDDRIILISIERSCILFQARMIASTGALTEACLALDINKTAAFGVV